MDTLGVGADRNGVGKEKACRGDDRNRRDEPGNGLETVRTGAAREGSAVEEICRALE